MSRSLAIAIHVVALITIAISLVVIAGRGERSGEIFAAALIGFVLGIAFDHWALRPLIDWVSDRSRR